VFALVIDLGYPKLHRKQLQASLTLTLRQQDPELHKVTDGDLPAYPARPRARVGTSVPLRPAPSG
jgi:hypothetical protein